ncbi:MAG: hypothetical protein CMK56_04235 [Proteobacteria bacterium]|nr:hypothetical protein [Pseudomonadota bacterium]
MKTQGGFGNFDPERWHHYNSTWVKPEKFLLEVRDKDIDDRAIHPFWLIEGWGKTVYCIF